MPTQDGRKTDDNKRLAGEDTEDIPRPPPSDDPKSINADMAHRAPILPTILSNIGNTPLVRINRIGKDEGVKAEICRFSWLGLCFWSRVWDVAACVWAG